MDTKWYKRGSNTFQVLVALPRFARLGLGIRIAASPGAQGWQAQYFGRVVLQVCLVNPIGIAWICYIMLYYNYMSIKWYSTSWEFHFWWRATDITFCVAGTVLWGLLRLWFLLFHRHGYERCDADAEWLFVSCSKRHGDISVKLARPCQDLLFHCIQHCTLTWDSALPTPHSTLRSLHSTLYTAHFTLYSLNLRLHTLQVDSIHSPLHTSLHTRDSTLPLYTVRVHPISHTPLSHLTLNTLHSSLHNPQSIDSTHHTLHSTLCTPPDRLWTFTLQSLHSTLHSL